MFHVNPHHHQGSRYQSLPIHPHELYKLWRALHIIRVSFIKYLFCVGCSSLVAQIAKSLLAKWETWVRSLGREDLLEKATATPPVFLPGESYGWRNLAGYSPWGHKESDMTEQLTLSQFHSVLGVLFPLPVSVPCLLLLLFDCYYSSLKNKKTGSQRLSNCLQTYQLLESGHDGSKALSKIPHHPLMKVPLPPCV